MNTRSVERLGLRLGLLALSALWLVPETAQAQDPEILRACYMPNTGVVYRIDAPDAPAECKSDRHIEFSWIDGLPGNDHGNLNGLTDDDHAQYLLASGERPLSGALDLDGNKIVDLPEASSAGEAVPFEQALKTGDAAGGDLGGAFPDVDVEALQGNPVADVTPEPGDMLRFNGESGRWEPAEPASASVLPEIVWVQESGAPQSGHTDIVDVACPEGFAVIAGGYQVQISLTDPSPQPRIVRNGPVGSGVWRVSVALEDPGALVGTWFIIANAICMKAETS